MPKDRLGRALRDSLDLEASLGGLQTRKTGEAPLFHPTRRRVFVAVFDNPGVALRPLARYLDLPVQSTRWHVEKLVNGGLVHRRRTGRGWELRADDLGATNPWLFALQCPTCLRVASVLQGPGKSQAELVRELATYPQALRYHLRRLREAGVASADRRRTWRLLRAPATLRAIRARLPRRRAYLLDVFERNGLDPKLVHDREDALTVDLRLPEGRERLSVPLLPRVVRFLEVDGGPVGTS